MINHEYYYTIIRVAVHPRHPPPLRPVSGEYSNSYSRLVSGIVITSCILCCLVQVLRNETTVQILSLCVFDLSYSVISLI